MKASASPYRKLDWLTTGYANLDKILGGGIPTRKISEISGVYSVGKSTLALSIIAEAQKDGRDCLLADIEFAFDDKYAEVLGVELLNLDLIQARFAEDALDEIEEWADKHKNGLIVVDSIGGLLPRQEAEKTADGKVIGGQAKLVSTFCRKMVPLLALNNNALLVLNHQFTDLMSGKLKTSGGAKLEYHRSIWLMLRKSNKRVMQGENQVGDIIEAEIRKNKCAPTMKMSTELTLLYGKGFLKGMDLMQDALDKGVITKQGNSYYFNGNKLCTGLPKLREHFKSEAFTSEVKRAIGSL